MTNIQLRNLFSKKQTGFTLIELLIVIAVIGVLATVVLVAIDPLEQLARARDSGRKSSVGQLVKATQAYYTSQGASYPPAGAAWQASLVAAGEIKKEASFGAPGCLAASQQNGLCFARNAAGTEVAIWTILESKSEKSKANCITGGATIPAFTWRSATGVTGTDCFTATTGAVTP